MGNKVRRLGTVRRERVGGEGSASTVVSLCKPRNQDFGSLGKHVECENHWLHIFLRLSKPLI